MRATFVALAGTITAVMGVLLWAVAPPIGLFFVALGGAVLLASPVIGLLQRSTDGSDG